MGWIRGTPKERWRKMSRWNPMTGCMEMLKSLDNCGYGRMRFKGKAMLAHRAAYEIFNGPFPQGMEVLHSCDNPRCVNPMHLLLGTHDENMKDMAAKGRARSPRGIESPHAKLNQARGHEIRWYGAMGWNHSLIAAMYNVTRPLVSGVIRGELWPAECHD